MIGILAAVSPDGVIGVGNRLPWHYPADLKRFKRLTVGHTIIMGRNTWESLPRKPLPHRRNLVVTSRALPADVETFSSVEDALAAAEGDVWFIGGRRIFEAAMEVADVIDLTHVPDRVGGDDAVHFPSVSEATWRSELDIPHEDDPRLRRQVYRRRVLA